MPIQDTTEVEALYDSRCKACRYLQYMKSMSQRVLSTIVEKKFHIPVLLLFY